MRTILIVGLILLLLAVALPALGSTDVTDSGATLINNDVLAPAGTPHATVKYVEAITGVKVLPEGGFGGSLNFAD
jgi:hypothetical protein